jgi:hypothetical protein
MTRVKRDLDDFAKENPGPIREALARDSWDAKVPLVQVLDAYLNWNGIHGYTGNIMHIFRMARQS